MDAYIYAWNPSKWKWIDLAYAVSIVNSGEKYYGQWSCGRSQKPSPNDIFLLMKLGRDPSGAAKGVVGCGKILSNPEIIEHWDESQRNDGKTVLSTSVFFDALSDRPLITHDELSSRFPKVHWTPQQSGISIELEVAKRIYTELTGSEPAGTNALSGLGEAFLEGEAKEITIRNYDRCSRAREACILHHGFSCAVCGFSFKERYGEIGSDYIEVHHLTPISEKGGSYLVNPIQDLRPVCANCHRMLHRRTPALSIEELRLCLAQ